MNIYERNIIIIIISLSSITIKINLVASFYLCANFRVTKKALLSKKVEIKLFTYYHKIYSFSSFRKLYLNDIKLTLLKTTLPIKVFKAHMQDNIFEK